MLSSKLMHGDCLDRLKELEDCSIDSIVTDPPYGLKFMGKKWDYGVPSIDKWCECLRVLKPGGVLLSFAGTRTQHRMAINIEDAGFEIRDMIAWVYGSGFPKSLDISKAIDKAAGAKREVVGDKGDTDVRWRCDPKSELLSPEKGWNQHSMTQLGKDCQARFITAPATPEAKQWEGWGTALKPAFEPITVARKPLSENTVAANVLKHGTGGINIDGCRIGHNEPEKLTSRKQRSAGWNMENTGFDSTKNTSASPDSKGRFPANLIHDGSDEVMELFPSVQRSKGNYVRKTGDTQFLGAMGDGKTNVPDGLSDSGSAARFFYIAKSSRTERNEGCSNLFWEIIDDGYIQITEQKYNALDEKKRASGNIHPTCKPLKLMRYLVKLVTPPNGIVLDPFMGSGTTGIACKLEGFNFVGVELDEDYIDIAKARIAVAKKPVTQINMELQ